MGESRDGDAHADVVAPVGETAGIAETYRSGDAAGPPGESEIARGTLVDRYIVSGEIGRGGMGVVLAAIDPDLQRPVAIKLLRPRAHVSDELRKRLVREGQAMAQVSHPNVVQIYDVGMHGTEVFIAMEMVAGMSLQHWLGQQRTRREILDVFAQAGRGLCAAHDKGIVHRDFKPDNVRVGDDGRVRVLDFGLARAVAAPAEAGATSLVTMTVEGSVIGTPAYMAPEQFAGGTVDAFGDQFAFCVALHEALCGQRPFEGATLDELSRNVRAGKRRPMPRSARVPAWLEKLLARGMAVSPADRHPTLAGLVAALERDRRVARWRWIGAFAAALALATAIAIATRRHAAPRAPDPAIRQVVREAGVHLHPSFLPDGVHYVHTNGTDIVLRSIDDETATNLTAGFEPHATEPKVSRDGTHVAFSADGGVYTMTIAGGEIRRVADGYWPAWSPDGTQLVYVTADTYDILVHVASDSSALMRVDLASGVRTELLPATRVVRQPAWSPDGKHLVVLAGNNLVTCRTDGSDVRDSGIKTTWHPVWASDGDSVYAVREHGGRFEIVRVAFDRTTGSLASASTPVTGLAASAIWHFDVARDGSRFIGAVFQSELRTYRVPFDAATGRATALPQPFTDPYRALVSPAVSPDGGAIAFAAMTEVEEHIYVSNLDASNGRTLTVGNEYRRAPVWRPDGKWITYQGSTDNKWGIYEVSRDGQARALKVASGYRFPHWSPDGKRLAITAPSDGDDRPYIVTPDQPWEPQQAAEEDAARDGWRTGPWSPDGKWIAVMSQHGIGKLDSATLAITPVLGRGSDLAWLPDGRHAIVAADSELLHVDMGTGEAAPIASLAPARVTALPSLAVTPSSIFVSARTEHASLWLVDLK